MILSAYLQSSRYGQLRHSNCVVEPTFLAIDGVGLRNDVRADSIIHCSPRLHALPLFP